MVAKVVMTSITLTASPTAIPLTTVTSPSLSTSVTCLMVYIPGGRLVTSSVKVSEPIFLVISIVVFGMHDDASST